MARRGTWLKHNPQATAAEAGREQPVQPGGVGSSPPSDTELEAAEALQSFSLSISATAPTASGSISPTKHQRQACSRLAMVVEDGASSPPLQQLEQHRER